MNNTNTTTSNLEEFGPRERKLLCELLTAWNQQCLPTGFYDHEVVPMMNKMSGNVFLTNSEFEVAIMNGDKLEVWNHCFECGHEGFEEDCQLYEQGAKGCNECNPDYEPEKQE